MKTSLNDFWSKIRTTPLIWDAITTTGWSTLGKGAGFLVPFFVAAWFGVTAETDAFFFTYGLILFVSGVFAPVIESVMVPYIAETKAKGEDVGKFVSKITGISGIGLLALTGGIILLIKPILSVITQFESQELDLVYQLLIETAMLIILLVWTSIFAGTLNAYKKFLFPAVSPALRALFNIAFIFIFKDMLGVHAIALGYVIGEISRLVILLGVIKQLKLFNFGLSFKLDSKLKEFLKTASYRIIGMAAGSLNPLIGKTMASWLGKGSISVLQYAEILYMIPVNLMVTGLSPVVLSHWSEVYYQKEEKGSLFQRVKNLTWWLVGGSIIIFLILLFLNKFIVLLAFNRGKFELKYLLPLRLTFFFYLLGLVPYVANSMFMRAHLVLKNTYFLMKLSILNCFLIIALNYFLMRLFGVAGIALSNSFSSLIVSPLLFFSLSRMVEARQK